MTEQTARPTIGRIVHYVLDNNSHRAALVVNAFGSRHAPEDVNTRANLIVFLDPLNDRHLRDQNGITMTQLVLGSVQQGEGPGTWHWPEREE